MRARVGSLVVLVPPACALLAPACAPPARCPELTPVTVSQAAVAPLASAAPSASTAPAALPAGPTLALTVTPRPRTASVDVIVVATAEPAALARLSFAPNAPFRLNDLRDDAGPMTSRLETSADGRAVVVLPRAVVGALRVAYTVEAPAHAASAPRGVDVDPNRFLASGEPLLLLPDALDERPVHAAIVLDPAEYEAHTSHATFLDGASSFGVGARREADVVGRQLRQGFYEIGGLGRALFDAPEGHDEAAWLGYTAFDPRPAAADVAGFRTAARELFRAGDEPPLTLLFVADARPVGAFSASRRARSVLVRVGAGEVWSGPVRIAVATEVLRAWIGGRLWIGPDDPAHEAESFWFTEGVTRWLARDLLFRFGLLTSREVADEVHGLAGVAATSPRAGEPNASLAARVKEPHALPLLVARGALHATRVQARLRAKSKGARGLTDVLRALLAKAGERRGPLPTSAWRDALAVELGPDEVAAFERSVERGQLEELPEDALGPCFRRAPRTYEAFDLGFDEDRTRAAADRVIVGLAPGGPAARAGVRAGDVLADAVIARGRSDVKVTLTLQRGVETVKLSYLPAGAKAKGQGFVRRPDVSEDACAK